MPIKPMGRREAKLERLAYIVGKIADVDERLAKAVATTKAIAEELKQLDYEKTGDRYRRNRLIPQVVNKEKTTIEPLLQKRRQLVQELLDAVAKTYAKDMKELKEELGLLTPANSTSAT